MRLLLAISTCIASVASAQPSSPAPLDTAEASDAVVVGKRESIAVALSWGTTLGGMGLVIGALYGEGHTRTTLTAASISLLWLGPTTGHIYLESPWTRGLRTRLVGTALLVGGAMLNLRYRSGDTEIVRDWGTAMIVSGAVAYLAGMGEELYEAGARVRRAKGRRVQTQLVPTTAGRLGMSLVGSF